MSGKCLWLTLLFNLAPSLAEAQQVHPSAATIGRFFHDETIGAAYLDLPRIDIESLWKQAFGEQKRPDDLRSAKPVAFIQELRQHSVKACYLFFDIQGLNKEIAYFVIPLDNDNQAAELKAVLAPSAGRYRFSRVDGHLVGTHESREFDFQQLSAPRKYLAAALAAIKNDAIQVVVVPTNVQIQALEITVGPNLPESMGGIPLKTLTANRWAAVGANIVPQFSLGATVQSADAETAAGLVQLFQESLARLAQAPGVEGHLAKQVRELLSPTVEDAQVVVRSDGENTLQLLNAYRNALPSFRAAAYSSKSMSHIRQIGLMLGNFESDHGHFPAASTYDADGNPLLSWRVQVLPYLGDEALKLYRQFRLQEPWDSPHNRKLIPRIPDVYRSPVSQLATDLGKTNYLVPIGPGTIIQPQEETRVRQIRDGCSKTVLLLEVDDSHAVEWTKPADWQVDPQNMSRGLGNLHRGRIIVAFCNCYVVALNPQIEAQTMLNLVRRNDGQRVDLAPLIAE